MAELKRSKKADSIGYLYRAALYFAKGDDSAAFQFLERICDQHLRAGIIQQVRTEKQNVLITPQKNRYWAEKLLDEYKRQMFLLRET